MKKHVFKISLAIPSALAAFLGFTPQAFCGDIQFVDLNHVITNGMVTFPGTSEVDIYAKEPRYANGAYIDSIKMYGITSTYIDSPYHVNENGKKISELSLENLVDLPIVVIAKAKNGKTFEIPDFQGLDVNGKAVLLHTGEDINFGKADYGRDYPFLSAAAATWLVQHKAKLVGIDAPLIDNFHDSSAVPAHDILLGNGVTVAEDMTNIMAVSGKNATLTAVPPRVEMASFPARIFAKIYR
ncbi:metal-dependent hydrolase [Pseudomonas fluorescens]|uniref:Metal-dependent hydrolase n=1 Tax=Pseudomonas fluorescens TaxID=294 RepID=A0A327NE90_PSEFL|nr:cyclase family protein [Pseudomonas fluorescens]RAI70888.1 metal-dependent hydrolase [Pseudomonas fluorescens]